MISSVCWLPRGAAKPVPLPAPLTEEELQSMREQAADMAADVLEGGGEDDADEPSTSGSSGDGWQTEDEEDEDEMDTDAAVAKARAAAAAIASSSKAAAKATQGKAAGGKAGAGARTIESALAELDMEHYDSEDDDGGGEGGGGGSSAGLQGGEASAAVVSRALGGRGAGVILDDPYLQAAGSDSGSEGGGEPLSDLDSEERDDYVLRDSDLLVLAARTEDDVSTLEVWVYEEASSSTGGEANIYVHHDILLPALPLSLAWMDVRPGAAAAGGADPHARANMVAVGGMDPGIEVWDLDISDQVEPAAVLGGYAPLQDAAAAAAVAAADEAPGGSSSGSKAAKKKAKAKAKQAATKALAARPLRPGSHSDAVLGLCWNAAYRNVLASASADACVKVWDVAACSCAHTLTHHSDKVQAVAWNPAEAPVLLSGSFDKTACLADVRQPDGKALCWGVSADVEALAWDPANPTSFLVSSEDGLVVAFDARLGAGSKPLFRLAAHNKPACVLSFCSAAPGLLATASTDKVAKLWDVSDGRPAMLASREPKLGAIFTGGFCRDVPYLLAMAGAKGSVGVWDVRSSAAVAAKWPQLLADAAAPTTTTTQ